MDLPGKSHIQNIYIVIYELNLFPDGNCLIPLFDIVSKKLRYILDIIICPVCLFHHGKLGTRIQGIK